MRIALAGGSICRELKTALEKNPQNEVLVIDEPKALARAADDGYTVILIENGEPARFLTDNEYAKKLLANHPVLSPVVFLLDLDADSPEYAVRYTLLKAKALADGHRSIVVLFKHAKTAFNGSEKLYENARIAGVTFIKYNSILKKEENLLEISGEDCEISIESPLVVDCSVKMDSKIEQFAKALRLKKLKSSYFLYPALTSRKNVFYISAPILYGRNSMPVLECIAESLDERESERIAKISAEKCAFCYTCYRVCPHAAPRSGESAMEIDENLCTGCGICSAMCPADAITIKAKAITDKSDKKTIIFACENSGLNVAERLTKNDDDVAIYPLKCGGELSVFEIIDALKHCERVIVAVCVEGACRHFDGAGYAKARVESLKETLAGMGEYVSRVRFIQVAHTQTEALKEFL